MTEDKCNEHNNTFKSHIDILIELLNNVPGAITVHDLNGNFLYTNQKNLDLHGYEMEEFMNLNLHDLDVPESEELINVRIEKIKNEGEATFTVHHFRKDGSKIPLEVLSKITFWDDKPVLLSVATDISERIEYEKKLKDNLALFRIAGEVAKLGGWNVNLEENRSYWSDVVAKIHEMPVGYAPMLEEGINFYAPEWRDKITKVFTDCATKGIPYNEKMEIITSTGKRVWIKTIGEAVRNEKGEIYKVHGGFQDITEEVEAEKKLKKSEERFRLIVDNSSDMIWILKPDGVFTYVSPSWKLILGYEPSYMEGKMYQSFVHPDDIHVCEEYLSETINGRKSLHGIQYRAKHVEGSWRWHEGTISPVYADDGSLMHFVGVSRDISDRKLAERELKLRSLVLDQITDIVTVTDMNGVITYINDAVTKSLNIIKENVIGKKTDIYGEDTELGATQKEIIEQTKKNGSWRGEIKNYSSDGSERIMDCRTRVVFDEKRKAVALCGISTDITDRKKSEQELRESEERFMKLSSFTFEGIIIHDKGIAIDMNQSAVEMLGYERDEITGMNLFKIIHPDFHETVKENIAKHFAIPYRIVVIRKNGSVFDAEIEARDISYNGENFRVACIRDVTERKKTEEKLKESEERYKALHNASFGGIAIHDKGKILECNHGLSDITGYSYNELIEMDGLLLIAEHARDKVIKNINDGYELPYESVGVRKNGEEYPLRLEARNIPFKGKKVRTVEFRDLTEQKKAEAEKQKLQNQLDQAQKIESIGRLAGGVAHDFNNMLSVILGRVELALIKTGGSSPVLNELVEIQNAAERSAALTRQLLAFARKQVISPKILDVNENIKKILVLVKRLIGENIELIWTPGKKVWSIMMDTTQLDQIFTNLCVNAKDAMPDGGAITISAENVAVDSVDENRPCLIQGDFVKISVEDNGHGMDKETASQIFEPFFTTKEHGKGTGLGLATVFGIVKQNNGFVYCFSEEGVGTRFEIYFHRKDGKNIETDFSKPICIKGEESITILLVEDEPAILEMGVLMLQTFGYSVVSAHSPQEALKKSLEYSGNIDLLITDVIMPEMNGRELSKKITSHHPEIKCLFMSGYTAEVIAHQGVIDEDMNFIQKPFTMKTLGEKVKTVMGVK